MHNYSTHHSFIMILHIQKSFTVSQNLRLQEFADKIDFPCVIRYSYDYRLNAEHYVQAPYR